MKRIRMNGGGLDVVVLEPEGDQRPDVNVVLCHGFGAPGDDLVPLSGELSGLLGDVGARVRWIFPEAPLSLAELGAPMGRAWWMIDVERLVMRRDWDRYVDEVPDGLPKARRMLTALIDDLSRRTGVGMSRTILGGFSQGAMLATDLTLRAEEAPLGLCVLSGALIARGAWMERAPKRTALPIFQSHGRNDPILPFEIGERLRKLFEDAGMSVTFVPFNGEHTIPMSVLEQLAAWMKMRLPAPAAVRP
ncbi:MAG: phospholipase [Myxococcaceae bacterium]|nr:phospholipase [Myxococcaceae bacterium]